MAAENSRLEETHDIPDQASPNLERSGTAITFKLINL